MKKLSKIKIAEFIDRTTPTMHNWGKQYPKCLKAVENAYLLHHEEWEQLLTEEQLISVGRYLDERRYRLEIDTIKINRRNNMNISKEKLEGKMVVTNDELLLLCKNHKEYDLTKLDVSEVTDMFRMFHNASDFNQDISNWDVARVRNMNSMFAYASAFNQDIGGWNVGNVINMSFMFDSTSAFNQDISKWNVYNVKYMDFMFADTSAFNQDISGWNVAKVTDMGYMFDCANAFNQDISGWNVSKVTNMSGMFDDTKAFNQDTDSWGWKKLKQKEK